MVDGPGNDLDFQFEKDEFLVSFFGLNFKPKKDEFRCRGVHSADPCIPKPCAVFPEPAEPNIPKPCAVFPKPQNPTSPNRVRYRFVPQTAEPNIPKPCAGFNLPNGPTKHPQTVCGFPQTAEPGWLRISANHPEEPPKKARCKNTARKRISSG